MDPEPPVAPAAPWLGQRCGVRVSASQLQQGTRAVGQTQPWLVVALDGVMVAEVDAWQAVRSAALAGAGGQASAAPRRPVAPPATTGSEPTLAPWRDIVPADGVPAGGPLGSLEAWRQGVEQAERVIGRGDGAGWMWSLAAEPFPRQCRSSLYDRCMRIGGRVAERAWERRRGRWPTG